MTNFLELKKRMKIRVIGSPMFIISNRKTVIEQCKSGIIGSMNTLNARPDSQLDEWLGEITQELNNFKEKNPNKPTAPITIKQIVHRSKKRLEEDMELCEKHKVPIIITTLGAREEVCPQAQGYGGVVLHDVINNMFAKKAIEKGADGLIAVAAGAGGHAGSTRPFALVQEIREWFDV